MKMYPSKIPTIEITKTNIYFNHHALKYQWSALSAASISNSWTESHPKSLTDTTSRRCGKRVFFKWYCTKHLQRPSLQTTRPLQWQWEPPHIIESLKIWKSIEYVVAATSQMSLFIEIKKLCGYNLLKHNWNPWAHQM